MTHAARVVISAALLFAVGISVDADQCEADAPKSDSDSAQTATDQNPPPNPGVGVKPGDANTNQGRADEQQERPGHLRRVFLERLVDPITWFTLLLFVVGVAQWFAMRRQVHAMLKSLDAAVISADAARDSARVARDALEETRRFNALALRPWLMVESIELTAALDSDSPVSVTVRNYGKLPAINCSRSYEFGELPVGESLGLIQPPPYALAPGGLVTAAGQPHTYTLRMRTEVPPDRLAQIARHESDAGLYLVARFTYTDAFDSRGDSAYCWRYTRTAAGQAHFEMFTLPWFRVL